MSLRDLKKNRSNMFAKLQTEVDKIKSGGQERQTDERFWQPTKDKVGNAIATIRFLSLLDPEELPWTKVFSHGFENKLTGAWFIENCPTTINQQCPVCKANTLLWNTKLEKNQNIARDRKRKLRYIANILVVSDPANPDNDGKVFLFGFGKKIFDKITEAMYPQFEDEKAVNPFDPWEGANFVLKVRKVEGYTNYDKSSFSAPTSLSDDDEEIEALLKNCRSLKEFTDPKGFKPYDELSKRLASVLDEEVAPSEEKDEEEAAEEEDDLPESFTKPVVPAAPAKKEAEGKPFGFKEKKEEVPAPKKAEVKPAEDDDDEMESYLRKLAEDE